MSGSLDDEDMDGDESLRRPSNGGPSTAKSEPLSPNISIDLDS